MDQTINYLVLHSGVTQVTPVKFVTSFALKPPLVPRRKLYLLPSVDQCGRGSAMDPFPFTALIGLFANDKGPPEEIVTLHHFLLE